jgi:hypothetical protein
MNMANEKTIDLFLSCEGSRVPARLYVRFNPYGVGVYLHLQSDSLTREVGTLGPHHQGVASSATTYPTLLAALARGLLPSLPDGAALEIDHTVRTVCAAGAAGMMVVRETITGRHIAGEPVAVFTLRFAADGADHEVTEAEDIYYGFRRVAEKLNAAWGVCGYCGLAEIRNYGDDDWRHGLFCFRDDPGALQRVRLSPDLRVWASGSWSNVDAFHSCPSFTAARWCLRLLEGDPPSERSQNPREG